MNAPVGDLKLANPLAKLRDPFPDNQVSKLPKETKAQSEQRKAEQAKGNWPDRCTICGGLHHARATHLDYVGHAALTDRLLDTDPEWSWEPVAFRDGLPAFDQTGGLWIKLTVCGVSRLGYGHAAAKAGQDPGAREKEVIGDALRNAAMRFGAALDLWHKGDLHAHVVADDDTGSDRLPSAEETAINMLRAAAADKALFKAAWENNRVGWKKVLSDDAYLRVRAVMQEEAAKLSATPPEPPKAPPAPATTAVPAADPYGIGDDDIPEFG